MDVTFDDVQVLFEKFQDEHVRCKPISDFLQSSGIGWAPDVPTGLDLEVPRDKAIYLFFVTFASETPGRLREDFQAGLELGGKMQYEGIEVRVDYRRLNAQLF